MNAKTIGIISIKGGVGKTSVTSALGASLANDFNKKVLLIDANFTAPNLAMHNGIYNPDVTLHHVLDGKVDASDAIYKTEYGFDIIPGALIYRRVNAFSLSEKIKDLKKKYDIILIDSSPNLNEEVLATMIASNELLAVATPDYITLASTLRAMKIAKDKKTPIIGLVLNKVYNKNFEVSIEDIENASGLSVLAVLPHEIEIMEALSEAKPSTLHKKTESSLEYKKLAACLIGEKYKENGFGKIIKKFFAKISKQDINRQIFSQNRRA